MEVPEVVPLCGTVHVVYPWQNRMVKCRLDPGALQGRYAERTAAPCQALLGLDARRDTEHLHSLARLYPRNRQAHYPRSGPRLTRSYRRFVTSCERRLPHPASYRTTSVAAGYCT